MTAGGAWRRPASARETGRENKGAGGKPRIPFDSLRDTAEHSGGGKSAAARAGLPVAALNRGRTRADELLSLKVEADCAQALAFLLDAAAPAPPAVQ